MQMTLKLFGSEIIVDSTPDSTTTTDDEALDHPAKEEPIIAAALTDDPNSEPGSFPNPNPSCSGVSTELGLGGRGENYYMIKKRLTDSDINGLSRLLVPRKWMEERVLPLMREEMRSAVEAPSGAGLMVDDDTGRVHKNMVVKKWHSCKSYVINGGWCKYTKTRNLQPNDEIGLGWDTQHCRFHITLLNRAASH